MVVLEKEELRHLENRNQSVKLRIKNVLGGS